MKWSTVLKSTKPSMERGWIIEGFFVGKTK